MRELMWVLAILWKGGDYYDAVEVMRDDDM